MYVIMWLICGSKFTLVVYLLHNLFITNNFFQNILPFFYKKNVFLLKFIKNTTKK